MSKEVIAKNRLWNFQQLIKAAGGNNAAARVLKLRDSQVSAYGRDKPARNIGDITAARIETAFGLPPGALDNPPPANADHSDPYLAEIVATLAHAKTPTKQLVLSMSQWAVSQELTNNSLGSDGVEHPAEVSMDSLIPTEGCYDESNSSHKSRIEPLGGTADDAVCHTTNNRRKKMPASKEPLEPYLTAAPLMTGGLCIGVTSDGECVVRPFGSVTQTNATVLAEKMVLSASRLMRFSSASG